MRVKLFAIAERLPILLFFTIVFGQINIISLLFSVHGVLRF